MQSSMQGSMQGSMHPLPNVHVPGWVEECAFLVQFDAVQCIQFVLVQQFDPERTPEEAVML